MVVDSNGNETSNKAVKMNLSVKRIEQLDKLTRKLRSIAFDNDKASDLILKVKRHKGIMEAIVNDSHFEDVSFRSNKTGKMVHFEVFIPQKIIGYQLTSK